MANRDRASEIAHEKTTAPTHLGPVVRVFRKANSLELELLAFGFTGLGRSRTSSVIRFFQFSLCLGHDSAPLSTAFPRGELIRRISNGSSIIGVFGILRKATRVLFATDSGSVIGQGGIFHRKYLFAVIIVVQDALKTALLQIPFGPRMRRQALIFGWIAASAFAHRFNTGTVDRRRTGLEWHRIGHLHGFDVVGETQPEAIRFTCL